MIEWVLILMACNWCDGNQGAVQVHSITGFSSRQECLDAGDAWIANARKASERIRPAALCVKQTVPRR
jgi:hypothetical protein